MTEIEIDEYRPGTLSGMIGLHMAYYAPTWNFGAGFEAKLAAESGTFLAAFDPSRDLIATAWQQSSLMGCIFIDGSERDGAGNHLRWFVVSDQARGRGLGADLMQQAMAFCDASAHRSTWLTTFAGLDAAAKLYQRNGFDLVSEADMDQWQGGVREQRYQRQRPN